MKKPNFYYYVAYVVTDTATFYSVIHADSAENARKAGYTQDHIKNTVILMQFTDKNRANDYADYRNTH